MKSFLPFIAISCFLVLFTGRLKAADADVTLVAHWPLDEVSNGATPDIVGAAAMELVNVTAGNLVTGKRGQALAFDANRNTLLARTHAAGDALPINQYTAYTVSLWVRGHGVGQSDLRVFSEGSDSDNTPLFNIGTDRAGNSGVVDIFIRPGANHMLSNKDAFDNDWHHVAWVQTANSATLYIDGLADTTDFQPAADLQVNNTTIGGIRRGSDSHWFTGEIDDVSLWKGPLAADSILRLAEGDSPQALCADMPDNSGGEGGGNPDNPPFEPSGDQLQINEFLASNDSQSADKNGEFTDWIELWNPTGNTIDLTGLFLTDEEGEAKWRLPSGSLASGDYLVIRASGAGDIIEGELHAAFRIGRASGYLALIDSDGVTVIDAYPAYPSQRSDVSYGRDAQGELAYFQRPTPAAKNNSGLLGYIGDTSFSHDRGFYEEAFNLEITAGVADAKIIYTIDGREPSEGNVFTGAIGTVYARPIPIKTTTTIRAKAFKSGFEPTDIDTQTYIFVDDVAKQPADPDGWPEDWGRDGEVPGRVVADYEMDTRVVNNVLPGYSVRDALLDLPSLSVVMEPNDFLGDLDGIYNHPNPSNRANFERPCSLELIYPDGKQGFQEDCGIEIHGNSSRRPWRMQKHSLRVSFKSDYGVSTLRYPFFPDTRVDRYNKIVLRACFTDSWGLVSWGASRYRPNDSQYIRDVWMKESMRDMGHESMRSTFMHLYINGLYWGLFNPSEKMEAEALVESLGGSTEDYDVIADFGGALDGNTAGWNAMLAAARKDLNDEANYRALQELVDLANFADYMLLHFFGDAEDWPHHNGHAMRNRGANEPFKFYVWDQEIVLDNLNVKRYDAGDANRPGALFQSLRKSKEFRLLFADRVQKHLFNGGALDVKPAQDRYLKLANIIDKAIVAESARWGDTQDSTPYGNTVDQPRNANDVDDLAYPTAPHAPNIYFTREASWVVERDNVINHYIPATHDRTNASSIHNELENEQLCAKTNAPSFNQHGGIVPSGFAVVMETSNASIHYTTDGSDPREFGGATSATAKLFPAGGAGVVLTETTIIRMRAVSKSNPFLVGGEWSALVEAKFRVGDFGPASNLVVSEIQYQPQAPNEAENAAGFGSRSDFEYVELLNTGSKAIILEGLAFSDGLQFTFRPGGVEELAADERVLIVNNPEAMAMRYGAGLPIAGAFERDSQLANNGETISLADGSGKELISFQYNDRNGWPEATDGEGPSLVLKSPAAASDHNDAAQWRASTAANGSPGKADNMDPGGEQPSAIATWLTTHFNTAEPLAALLHFDPDGDQLSNLVEFAFDLDPNKISAHPLVIERTPVGIELLYGASSGVLVVPEVSAGLENWSADARVFQLSNDGDKTIARYLGDDANASFRLRVQMAE